MPRRPRDYAERTHASPYWIVRFPHERRFAAVVDLIAARRAACVLDYGAGDGHFVTRLLGSDRVAPTTTAVAYEPVSDLDVLESNLARAGLADRASVVANLEDLSGSFDFIACMGVLEHLPMAGRQQFYDAAHRLLDPGGMVAIDVPVEIGPAVLIKNAGRRLLKRDARQYELRELIRVALGGRVYDPERFTSEPSSSFISLHRGFDHRLLREEVSGRLRVVGQLKTPFNWLPVALNQEIILLAEKRPTR